MMSKTDKAPQNENTKEAKPVTVDEFLFGALQKAESTDDIIKMTRLIEERDAEFARKQFTEAFLNLQEGIPNFVKDTQGYGYKYVTFDTMWEVLKPLFTKNGFTLSFQQKTEIGEGGTPSVTVDGIMTHIGGHSIRRGFTGPGMLREERLTKDGKGTKMSSQQAEGAVSTYYKRYLLSNMLAVAADADTDAQPDRGSGEKKQAPPKKSAGKTPTPDEGQGGEESPEERKAAFIEKILKGIREATSEAAIDAIMKNEAKGLKRLKDVDKDQWDVIRVKELDARAEFSNAGTEEKS